MLRGVRKIIGVKKRFRAKVQERFERHPAIVAYPSTNVGHLASVQAHAISAYAQKELHVPTSEAGIVTRTDEISLDHSLCGKTIPGY